MLFTLIFSRNAQAQTTCGWNSFPTCGGSAQCVAYQTNSVCNWAGGICYCQAAVGCDGDACSPGQNCAAISTIIVPQSATYCSTPPPSVVPTPTPTPTPPPGQQWCGNCNNFTCGLRDAAGCAAVGDTDGDGQCEGTCNAPPSPNGNVTGYHDGFEGTVTSFECRAGGWAADPDNTSQDVQVRALSDGVVVASGLAGGVRAGLDGVCAGGSCAFDLNLFGAISNNVNHTITAQALDLQTNEWRNLNLTPKILNCCGNMSTQPVLNAVPTVACGNTSTTISWSTVNNASYYSIRLDDTTASAGWSGDCSSLLAGDRCFDTNLGASSYSLSSLAAGHNYRVWVTGRNSCGAYSGDSNIRTFTVASTLSFSGSSPITIGTPQTFSASMNPSSISLSRVDFSGTNGTGSVTVNPASDNTSLYQTAVSGVTPGTASVTATAYTSSGPICSTTVPVTVNNPAPAAWWQVRGGDVSVAGALTSLVPTTCTGGCNPVFNLPAPGVLNGNINQFWGSADFSASSSSTGTGSAPDWRVNAQTQLNQVYNYNFFRNAVPSTWETSIINISGNTLDTSTIPTLGTPVNGYYVLYRNGDLTLTGDAGITSNKIILFVENGDLTLGNSSTSRMLVNDGVGFFMAIVGKGTNATKGNIIVSPLVTSANGTDFRYEGIFLAEGQFRTSTGGQLALKGSFAAFGGFDLDRDLADDSLTPAEVFDFAPYLFMTYPQALSNKRIRWQEVAP